MKKVTQLASIIPAVDWLRRYQPNWLRGDIIAGITVAMMLIPQAMSYALLAGLPPYIGLYAAVVPLLVYALFGTSRQLAVGPVAMISLLVVSGIGSIAVVGSEEYIALAIVLAFLVGLVQLVMGIFRLGFLTNFLSHPVISGFTSAAALIIAFSQLKHVVGLSLPNSENIFELAWLTISQITAINPYAFAIGIAGIVILLTIKRFSPLLPGPMIVVILSTVAVYFFNLQEQGVKIVGSVPAGFPEFALPQWTPDDLGHLLHLAVIIALIGFMESIAVAKKMAAQHRYEIDPNKELIGLGLANFAASLFKAMPVTGGFSRTAVNNDAGANTPLASIITAVVIGIALIFFTPLFYYIPNAILGSVIMVAVIGLVDIKEVKHLWKVKKDDLALLLFTFTATLVFGVEKAVFIAVAVSMVWLVIKTTRPHYAVLGVIPNSDAYRNLKRHPDAQALDHILAIRFDAQFYYGNVSFLKEILKKEEKNAQSEIKAIVFDASAINQLDSSADTALHELLRDYRLKNIELFFANIKGPVEDVMRRSSFIQALGENRLFLTMPQAMAAAKDYLAKNLH